MPRSAAFRSPGAPGTLLMTTLTEAGIAPERHASAIASMFDPRPEIRMPMPPAGLWASDMILTGSRRSGRGDEQPDGEIEPDRDDEAEDGEPHVDEAVAVLAPREQPGGPHQQGRPHDAEEDFENGQEQWHVRT